MQAQVCKSGVGAGSPRVAASPEWRGSLRVHDVDVLVLVLQKDAEPSKLVRSLGLQPRSFELMDERGLLDRFLAHGRQYPVAPATSPGSTSPRRQSWAPRTVMSLASRSR